MVTRARLPQALERPTAGFVLAAVALVVVTGLLAPVLEPDRLLVAALLYLLLTLVAAATRGYAVGLFTAVAANLLLNFFFVPPLHGFAVQKSENIAALAIFLAVAVVGAWMLARLRRQVLLVKASEAESNVLLEIAREMAHEPSAHEALERLCQLAVRAFGADECAVLRETREGWEVASSTATDTGAVPPREEHAIAAEALRTGEIVVRGTPTSGRRRLVRGAGAAAGAGEALTVVPFRPGARERGVLRITGRLQPPPLVEADRLLLAFADEASLALHRARLADEAQRAEALEQADEFKAVLLSSVSHDLRSPLTAIKTAVQSLRDASVQWTEEDEHEFIATIDSQTERLISIVNDLLEIGRLESGTVRTEIEPVEVEPLLLDAVAASQPLLGDRAVSVQSPPDTWVHADYALLMRALGNLIENAVKYSTPGCAICLRAEPAGDRLRMVVEDEGPGIAREDQVRIFEKFYRGAQAGKTRGTGLGLSIAKAMVELSGGTISARSSSAGMAFTITLPATGRPAIPGAAS